MSGLGLGSGLLVSLLFLALIVGRFLLRELRDRRVPFSRFFIVPGVFAAVAAGLIVLAVTKFPSTLVAVAAGTPAALAVGAGIGLAVDRFTSVRLDPSGPGAILRGSPATVAIWTVALALRLVGRYIVFAAGVHALGITLALNAVLVVMLAAALVVLRVRLFARAKALRGGLVTARDVQPV